MCATTSTSQQELQSHTLKSELGMLGLQSFLCLYTVLYSSHKHSMSLFSIILMGDFVPAYHKEALSTLRSQMSDANILRASNPRSIKHAGAFY